MVTWWIANAGQGSHLKKRRLHLDEGNGWDEDKEGTRPYGVSPIACLLGTWIDSRDQRGFSIRCPDPTPSLSQNKNSRPIIISSTVPDLT